MVTLRCRANGCKRLLGEFESNNPVTTYCPECDARISGAVKPTLRDCQDWRYINHGEMRRDHIGGAGRCARQ